MKTKYFLSIVLLLMAIGTIYAQSSQSSWKTVDGISIPVPPKEHPRLYLRSGDIPDVKARMSDPALAKVWKELQAMRQDWKPEDIPAKKDFRYYFNQKGVTVRAQLDALDYLVSNNKKKARGAIVAMLDTLENAKFPKHGGDIARGVGLLMISGSMVYDWCYDQLTAKEKQRFITSFVNLAKQLECGYPPLKQGSLAGHSSEWMIMRDLLSTGIAIYDEFPEMYELAAGRFFKEHLPTRNFFYPSHNYHQGTSYFNVRFTNDLFPLWIFDRMGFPNIYHTSQQFVMYDILYRRRPDGQVLYAGDENPTRRRDKTYSLPAMLASSYYKDEYIHSEFQLKPDVEAHCKIFEFLWRDTKLGVRKPDDLPLSRYSGTPFGWMIARTGWGDDSVIAEMKVNEYVFNNHQHHDGGAFQIYYRGPLAIDTGTYQGTSGGYNSPHNKNYFKRTIAHNSLLIFDPEEKFPSMGYGGGDKTPFVENEGGQRLPGKEWGECRTLNDLLNTNFKVGQVLAQGFGPDQQAPDYTYLKGDITDAYSAKVKEVKRSFVFLNLKDKAIPAAMIVFDKVVSANPDFKKFWLLHSMEEPIIEGNQTIIKRTKDGDSGMLVNTTLLPELANADIVPVGGSGKEFWAFGKNYPNIPAADDENQRGSWRIEISPKQPAAEDYYLNVIQITDNTQKTLHNILRLDGEQTTGVQVSDRVVVFSKNAMPLESPFTVSVKGTGNYKFLVTDLRPGNWQVWKDGKLFKPTVYVRSDDGALSFEGEAGEYKFLR